MAKVPECTVILTVQSCPFGLGRAELEAELHWARVSVCGTGHRLSQELEIPGPCDKHKRDQKLCSVLNGAVCCPMTKRPLALDVSTKLIL